MIKSGKPKKMGIPEKEINEAIKNVFIMRECGECGYQTTSKNPKDEIAEHWITKHKAIIKRLIIENMDKWG